MKTAEVKIKRTAGILMWICVFSVLALLVFIIVKGSPFVTAFADGEDFDVGTPSDPAIKTATTIVFQIARGIAIVLGAFFMVFGIIKVAIANANENGPEQNKAIMQLAVGLILILFGTIVLTTKTGTNGSIYWLILEILQKAMVVD